MGKRRRLIRFGCTWLSWFFDRGRLDRRSGVPARSFLGGEQEVDVHD